MRCRALPKFAVGLVASTAIVSPAWGQTEANLEVDSALVVSLLDDDDATRDAESFLGEVSIAPSVEHVLENSAAIGVRGALRFQLDHPQRSGFTGSVGDCPSIVTGCPVIGADGAPVGALGRLSVSGATEDVGPRGSIESAFIYVEGGWGEISAGLDQGVGQRFSEGGPEVFSMASLSDPVLDPSGLNAIRTRNNVSGASAKISYSTPRILGVRAGASYTPTADHRGLDLDLSSRSQLGRSGKLKDVVELGAQASHLFREADLRLRASVTHTDASINQTGFSGFSSTGAGLELSRRDQFAIGIRHVTSSNGVARGGDYRATQFGAETYVGDWTIGVEYAVSNDNLIDVEGENWSIGASRPWIDRSEITVGYQSIRTTVPESIGGQGQKVMRESHGLVVEFKIRH